MQRRYAEFVRAVAGPKKPPLAHGGPMERSYRPRHVSVLERLIDRTHEVLTRVGVGPGAGHSEEAFLTDFLL